MTYTIEELDVYVLDSITSGACDPVSNRKNALAIRVYGDAARFLILAKRADFQARRDATARKWQHSVSRRSLRNRNYDSVATREEYVRGVRGFDRYEWLRNDPAYVEHGRWHRHPVKGFQSGRVS